MGGGPENHRGEFLVFVILMMMMLVNVDDNQDDKILFPALTLTRFLPPHRPAASPDGVPASLQAAAQCSTSLFTP